MTRLFDVTVGKFDEFKRRLAEGNLDGELIDVLLARQELIGGMIGWAREQLIPPAVGGRIFSGSNLIGWFGEPEEQLANMRRWNSERGWGFTEGLFPETSDFPEAPVEFIPTHKQEVLVLVAYLPDEVVGGMRIPGYIRTYNEYLRIIKAEQPGSRFYARDTDVDHLRLLPAAEERHQPGIRWMVVNLGAYPDTPPVDIRDKDSAHAEVLAIFAQMPAYVQAQRWFEPSKDLCLAGYQATGYHGTAWSNIPRMHCHKSSLERAPRNEFDIREDDTFSDARNTFTPTARQL